VTPSTNYSRRRVVGDHDDPVLAAEPTGALCRQGTHILLAPGGQVAPREEG